MGTIHTRVAVALRFIDATTEDWVSKAGIGIQVAQQNQVLWKEANCAVILAQPGVHNVDILISGGIYQDTKLHIDLPASGGPLMQYIWMSPTESYPFAGDMIVVRGKCTENNSYNALYAMRQEETEKYKLMETTAAGDNCIRLWGLGKIAEERTIMLCENGERECITLLGQAQEKEHSYYIKGRMKKSFHKGRAKVYMITKVLTDNDGKFIYAYQRRENCGGRIQFLRGDALAAELEVGKEREYYAEI